MLPESHGDETANAGLVIGVGLGSFFLIVLTTVVVYGFFVWSQTNAQNKSLTKEFGGHVEQSQLEQRDAQAAFQAEGYEPVWIERTEQQPVLQMPHAVGVQRTIERYNNR